MDPDTSGRGKGIPQRSEASAHHAQPEMVVESVTIVSKNGAGIVRRVDVDELGCTETIKRCEMLDGVVGVTADHHIWGIVAGIEGGEEIVESVVGYKRCLSRTACRGRFRTDSRRGGRFHRCDWAVLERCKGYVGEAGVRSNRMVVRVPSNNKFFPVIPVQRGVFEVLGGHCSPSAAA